MLGRAAYSYHWNHDYDKSRELESHADELAAANGAEAAIAFSQMVNDERELVHGRGLDDDTPIESSVALAEIAELTVGASFVPVMVIVAVWATLPPLPSMTL